MYVIKGYKLYIAPFKFPDLYSSKAIWRFVYLTVLICHSYLVFLLVAIYI